MKSRLLVLPKNENILLFGPRNCGKTTLIKHEYTKEQSIYIDLLNPNEEERFTLNPNELIAIVEALPETTEYIIIDEIQKIPKLLNIIHLLIERTKKKFILTGSSAKKLKQSGVNLLAGRALVYNLFPFSYFEVQETFDLQDTLQWGMLPKIFSYNNNSLKNKFLQSYAQTYLKEEIWAEHLIRNLDPFRKFLEVAAQMNGKIINYNNIARDVGVDDKTIKNYYLLLEDTLIGFFLDGFNNSFRKRLNTKPKFYFFDTGVCRALSRTLSINIQSKTTAYGDAFEHFIITECIKLSSYYHEEYRFSYIRTKDNMEVDLIVDRPGLASLFIKIKSTDKVTSQMITSFSKIVRDFGECEGLCFSNDPYKKQIDNITIIPWQQGLKEFFC